MQSKDERANTPHSTDVYRTAAYYYTDNIDNKERQTLIDKSVIVCARLFRSPDAAWTEESDWC